MKTFLSLGVLGKSFKNSEKRLAIHPDHIKLIPLKLRKQITFEEGYGLDFGMDDITLAKITSGKVVSRKKILEKFDCVIILKPTVKDFSRVKEGTVVLGWIHCIQQKEITQIAIEKNFTLIAMEKMLMLNDSMLKKNSIFFKHNEIAGHASVNHALSLFGILGKYGKQQKIVVFGFGSVGLGAVQALQSQEFKDITVYTNHPSSKEKDKLSGIIFKQIIVDDLGRIYTFDSNNNKHLIIEELVDASIIINGIYQDVNKPKIFISEKDSSRLMKGTLIIDISCDEGMGFWCAKPTSFQNPIIEVNEKYYYGVDNSPSLYWNSATWEVSKILIHLFPIIMKGPKVWEKYKVISKSIEIDEGIIKNSKIILFQKRKNEYPYRYI